MWQIKKKEYAKFCAYIYVYNEARGYTLGWIVKSKWAIPTFILCIAMCKTYNQSKPFCIGHIPILFYLEVTELNHVCKTIAGNVWLVK